MLSPYSNAALAQDSRQKNYYCFPVQQHLTDQNQLSLQMPKMQRVNVAALLFKKTLSEFN